MNIKLAYKKKIDFQQLILNGTIFLLGLNYLIYCFFSDDQYKNALRIFLIPILAVAIFYRRKFSRTHLIILAASLYALAINGDMALNIAFILIISVISITLCGLEKEFVRILNRTQILLSIIVLIALLLGIVTPKSMTVGGRIRNDLGFMNINSAAVFFSSTILLYCMCTEKMVWHKAIFVLLLSVFLWRLTDSRTSFLGILLFFITLFILYLLRKKKKIQRWYLTISAVVLLCSPLLWQSGVLNNFLFNQLLSLRPRLFSKYCQDSSIINLFIGGSKAGEIDNAWLMLLYNIGLPLYIAFGALTLRALRRLVDVGNCRSASFLIMMLAVGMMETLPLRCEILTAILFWYIVIKYGTFRKSNPILLKEDKR